ncbi:unnamed protein product, partial [Pleuronectes platessa]
SRVGPTRPSNNTFRSGAREGLGWGPPSAFIFTGACTNRGKTRWACVGARWPHEVGSEGQGVSNGNPRTSARAAASWLWGVNVRHVRSVGKGDTGAL